MYGDIKTSCFDTKFRDFIVLSDGEVWSVIYLMQLDDPKEIKTHEGN